MNDKRTIYELTRDEFEELKVIMLFDDAEEFYETIDEITDESVYAKFGSLLFTKNDFSCNYAIAV
ncbi:MAG: hypothetical protein J6U54_20010 [Clostridiales bacterium]|nr:hypothetical protein [Clostridiales bacterium]